MVANDRNNEKIVRDFTTRSLSKADQSCIDQLKLIEKNPIGVADCRCPNISHYLKTILRKAGYSVRNHAGYVKSKNDTIITWTW